MPIDTSMYGHEPSQFNPLQAVGQVTSIQNALQQNQALQLQNKTTQSEQRMSQIFSKYTSPGGEVDTTNALKEIASDPSAALSMPKAQEIVNRIQEPVPVLGPNNTPGFRPRQVVNSLTNPVQGSVQQPSQLRPLNSTPDPQQQQKLVDTTHNQLDGIIDTLTPLIEKPNPTKEDVISSKIDLVSQGYMTHQEAAASFSDQNLFSDDPKVVKTALQKDFNQYLSHKATLTSKFGPPSIQQDQTQDPPNTSQQTTDSTFQATGTPAGYEGNLASLQQHYSQVRNEADNVGQQNAVLDNILKLSKSGAPTGTMVGQLYQYLASKVPGVSQGITDKAQQLQEISKYMHQTAINNGMPGSDARLEALQDANPNSGQLPGTIQSLIPFLEASNQGKIARANYYKKVAGNGLNADAIAQAQNNWQNSFDPRIIEYNSLSYDEKKSYVKKISPADARALVIKSNQMKQLGVQ